MTVPLPMEEEDGKDEDDSTDLHVVIGYDPAAVLTSIALASCPAIPKWRLASNSISFHNGTTGERGHRSGSTLLSPLKRGRCHGQTSTADSLFLSSGTIVVLSVLCHSYH